MTLSSPHDALFKYVFSQPEHAASELRAVLPAALSARLDWSSLEPQPASFVDERLNARQADLLFTIRCEGRQAYLYVLLEHQSTSDPLMAFRLLRYVVRIWDAFLAEHPEARRLPAIIPVVVHHSDGGWTAATDLCALIDLDAETLSLVASYIPQFRFVLDDLSHTGDRALRGRSLTAAAGLMLLSRGRSAPHLLDDCSVGSTCSGRSPAPRTAWRRCRRFWSMLSRSARCSRKIFTLWPASSDPPPKRPI